MKILILGGTRFLGRALVDAALNDGHEVTLFNRGQSNPDLYPDLEQLQGDRDGGLQSLAGREWDVAIDTCGYVPRLVGDSARLLAERVSLYTFISSISVYADPVAAGSDENAPLATMDDNETEEITGGSYGPLKVLCEQAATEAMDGRALLVRAGLLVGPHDPTDRFTYWPCRVAAGGDILAPGAPQATTQFIDVRDIAEWTVHATAAGLRGPYNITGPAQNLTMAAFLAECCRVSGVDSALNWAEESFLLAHEVAPFMDLPLWLPEADGGIMQVDIARALSSGLGTRELADTIRDTLIWANGRPADYEWKAGLSRVREAELLQLWHTNS